MWEGEGGRGGGGGGGGGGGNGGTSFPVKFIRAILHSA